MNPSEHNDDLFAGADPHPRTGNGEIRFDADEVACETPAQSQAGGLGERLQQARLSRGLSLQECGHSLRLPMQVLQRLEAGDLGAADHRVFVRGALCSYARLLGVPVAAVDSALHALVPDAQPPLVSTAGATQRRRWPLQRYGAAATYIVLTATVAVPLVWLGLRGGLDNQLTKIAPLDSTPALPAQHVAAGRPATQQGGDSPLLASMTPFPAMSLEAGAPAAQTPSPSANQPGHVLTLQASADSWIEVVDAQGDKLDSGILHAGEQRSYHSESPLSVTIGNVDGVQVSSDGKALSLEPYRHANVARFRVFAPAGGNG